MTAIARSGPSLPRIFLAIAAFVYLVWWFAVEAMMPGAFNPLGSRLAVVGFFAGGFLWSGFAGPRAAPMVFEIGCALLMLHYFYLFHHNSEDIRWVVGTYVTVMAVALCQLSERAVFIHSAWTLFLGGLMSVLHPRLQDSIFFPGLLTILALTTLSIVLRLRAQAKLAVAEGAQRGVLIRDEFISIASHELRTPLTSALLMTQFARRANDGVTAKPWSRAQETRAWESLEKHLLRLAALIEDMLNVSRISAGRLLFRFEAADLAQIATDSVRSLSLMIEASSSAVTLDAAAAPVRADPIRMEQVVSNLLVNALKYGAKQPIEVSVRPTSEGGAELRVKDGGIGIPQDKLDAIFERFERAVGSVHISGLGLGLYIAREIVAAHGGSIGVTSELEKGSVFTVTLPPAPASHSPLPH